MNQAPQIEPQILLTGMQELDRLARRFRRRIRDIAVQLSEETGDSAPIDPDIILRSARAPVENCSRTSIPVSATETIQMSTRNRPLSGGDADVHPKAAVSFDVDDAIVDASAAIEDGLLEYVNSRLQFFGKKGPLPADFSDALLISVLRLISPDGKYATESGRFWQILDRHGPFSPAKPDQAIRAHLAIEVEGLFAAAENETFNDGFDSVLSSELQRIVLQYGYTVVEIVARMILEGHMTSEVAAEALRSLGEMRSKATHQARRQLLERALESPSNITRDGAVVGLSHLGDPLAIPALDVAAAREESRLLRANMLDLASQLREQRP